MRDDVTCQNCFFWDGFTGQVLGQCRRRAPVPATELTRTRHASWPFTRRNEWCGELVPVAMEEDSK